MSIKRRIKKEMDIFATMYPILALTGPRQSGKTTFLKTEFEDYRYVNLENPDFHKYAFEDPNGFLQEYSNKVIFDEIQRVPFLFSYLQTKVDEDRIMGQFIISGSQNFHLMDNISQSLAGRVAIFKLFPFDIEELNSKNFLDDDYAITMTKGFYPAIFDRNIPSKNFFSNYIQTYVERDVNTILNIKELAMFRKFLSLCAARSAQLLNLNALANECGISQPTAKSWLSVLENSYIVYQLQPYHSNLNKRVTKSSKLYFYDTGLLSYLLKVDAQKISSKNELKGIIFENFVVSEFIKNNFHQNLLRDHWFWRDAVGHEVDFIWQDSPELNIVEIKSSSTIMPEMFKGLDYFEKYFKNSISSKTLIHSGLYTQKRTAYNVDSWQKIPNI